MPPLTPEFMRDPKNIRRAKKCNAAFIVTVILMVIVLKSLEYLQIFK